MPGLERHGLGDGAVDQALVLRVGLEAPVPGDHVVSDLDPPVGRRPAPLGVGGVERGQDGARVGRAPGVALDEGPPALGDVLEVLEHGGHRAGGGGGGGVGTGLVAGARHALAADGDGHVPAGGTVSDLRPGAGLVGALVQGHLLAQGARAGVNGGHGVALGVLGGAHRAGGGVGVQAGVEAGVGQDRPGPPAGLGRGGGGGGGVEDEGRGGVLPGLDTVVGRGGDGHGAVGDGQVGDLDPAGVGQAVQGQGGLVLVAVGQGPGGLPARGVVVVQAGAALGAAVVRPGQQVGGAGQDLGAVVGDRACRGHVRGNGGGGGVTVGQVGVRRRTRGDRAVGQGVGVGGAPLPRGGGLAHNAAGLEELHRQVVAPDVGVEGLLVLVSRPPLELHDLGVAQGHVGVPVVLVGVVDKADDLGVQALELGAAVALVVGPVGPGGEALELVRPLAADLPALLVEVAAQAVGQPPGAVVDVDVDPAEAGVLGQGELVTQLLEALGHLAAAQVVALVNVVGGAQPVPALGAGEGQGAELLGVGVGLGGIDVDPVDGVAVPGGVEEGLHVPLPASALVNVVAVVRVGRVVALGGISLEHDALAQAVGGQADAPDVVGSTQEGVGGLGGEVEGDVGDDPLVVVRGTVHALGDIRVGDGAVLPVHAARAVGVGGEHEGGVGPGLVADGVGGGRGAVGPLSGLDGQGPAGAVVAGPHHLAGPPAVVHAGGPAGLVGGRVGLHADGDLGGVDQEVGRPDGGGVRGGVGGHGAVGVLDPGPGVVGGGAPGHARGGGGKGGAGVVGGDRHQGLPGDLHRVAPGEAGDPEGQGRPDGPGGAVGLRGDGVHRDLRGEVDSSVQGDVVAHRGRRRAVGLDVGDLVGGVVDQDAGDRRDAPAQVAPADLVAGDLGEVRRQGGRQAGDGQVDGTGQGGGRLRGGARAQG